MTWSPRLNQPERPSSPPNTSLLHTANNASGVALMVTVNQAQICRINWRRDEMRQHGNSSRTRIAIRRRRVRVKRVLPRTKTRVLRRRAPRGDGRLTHPTVHVSVCVVRRNASPRLFHANRQCGPVVALTLPSRSLNPFLFVFSGIFVGAVLVPSRIAIATKAHPSFPTRFPLGSPITCLLIPSPT